MDDDGIYVLCFAREPIFAGIRHLCFSSLFRRPRVIRCVKIGRTHTFTHTAIISHKKCGEGEWFGQVYEKENWSDVSKKKKREGFYIFCILNVFMGQVAKDAKVEFGALKEGEVLFLSRVIRHLVDMRRLSSTMVSSLIEPC